MFLPFPANVKICEGRFAGLSSSPMLPAAPIRGLLIASAAGIALPAYSCYPFIQLFR